MPASQHSNAETRKNAAALVADDDTGYMKARIMSTNQHSAEVEHCKSMQVALAVDLEGDGRQPEGEGAAELLTIAADVWQHSIRPMHREKESYHEGQVHI